SQPQRIARQESFAPSSLRAGVNCSIAIFRRSVILKRERTTKEGGKRFMSRPALAFSIVHGEDNEAVFEIGDVIRSGDNLYPYYEVIAISGGRAWVRDIQYGTDCIVAIGDFHKI